MSQTIDERVVEMRFDNQQFESNVRTSMSTLDKLKQSLNLTGAAKGLQDIDEAARSNNIPILGQAVEAVSMKFSALQVMAITALSNIANSAVNAGKRLISAFTIDPIKTGLAEYETQINAVQTILANTSSKGTTLDDVNSALDELNRYADKTIYNFTEMTRNIGTFTAAGLDLDTSTKAIQGIANLAAVSGSTSQQASTAMYQLSQALSSGTVKLQDWNSVVNAGMGGKVFQDALQKTAKQHGTDVDALIKKYGSFRETLTTGWITSDILAETLSKMTKTGAAEYLSELTGIELDQIEAAQQAVDANKDGSASYEELAEKMAATGKVTKDEAIEILKMADTAEDAATKVKTFSQLMDTLKEAAQSGWTQTWEILIGDFEQAKELWTSVSDYFSEVINKSAEARNKVLEGWAKMGGRDLAIESIKNVFNGLLSVIKPIKEAFREIFPPITAINLLKITVAVTKFTRMLKLSSDQAEKVKSIFKGFFSIIKAGISVITKIAGAILKLIPSFSGIGGSLLDAAASFGDFLTRISETITKSETFNDVLNKVVGFIQNVIGKITELGSALKSKFEFSGLDGLKNALQSIWDIITKVASKIGEFASKIGDAFAQAFTGGDISNVLNILNGGLFAGILLAIRKFVNGLTELTSGGDGIKGFLDSIKDAIQGFQDKVKPDTLRQIAISIAILAGSLLVLSLIDPERLSSASVALATLFGELIGATKLLSTFDLGSSSKAVNGMIKLAVAVLILSIALKKVGDLSWEQIGKGLTGVTVLLGEVVGAAILLGKYGKRIKKVGWQMILIAAAMEILVDVCKKFGDLSWEQIGKGLAGIGAILLEFVGFQALMSLIKPKKLIKSALALVLIGAAMEIFADVVSKLSGMNWDELGRAGAAIGGILILASVFLLLSGLAEHVVKSAIALVLIGAAMEIFADVVNKFSEVKWEELKKAGVAMAGVLAMSALFSVLSGLSDNTLKSAVSLILIGAAMEIFADVAKKFEGIDWEVLKKAGVAMGGVLAMASIFSMLSGLSDGILKSAFSLVIMGAAFKILVPVFQSLGDMELGQIGKALLAMAGAFTILGVAGLLLGPIVLPILAVTGALALFGLACLAVGAGVTLFAIGLTSLAAIVPAHIASIIGSLTLLIRGIGVIISSICYAIADSAKAIGAAVKAVVLTLIDVMVECVPPLVEGLLVVISQLLASLVEHAPEIADSLITLILGIINTLSNRMGEIVEALTNFVVSALDSLSTAIPELIAAGVEFVGAIIQGIADALGPIVEQIIIPLAESLGSAIEMIADGLAPIVESVSQALQSICDAFVSLIEQIVPIIDSTTSLIQQLGDSISQVFTSVALVIATCGDSISQVLSGIAETINSVFSGIGEVITSIGESIKSVLDGIAGIIESIGNAALNAGTGFENLANGVKTITELNLVDMGISLAAVAKGLKDIASNSEGLAAAGTSMQQIATSATMSSTAFNQMANGLSKATSLILSLGPAAASAATSMATAATTGSAAFTSAFRAMIFATLTSLTASVGQFRAAGSKLMVAFGSGISSGKGITQSALRSVINACKSAMSSYSSSFSGLGRSLVQGFASGITANTFIAEAAAKIMASKAYIAAKNQLDVNSPSKVFRKLGYSVPEGFAQGIDRLGSIVTKSSVGMANSAIDSVSSAISRIGDSVSTDVTPTISPVVDFDNAKKASLNITGNIDNVITKPVSSLSQIISASNDQLSASNKEVVSAIGDLRKELQDLYSADDKEISLYVDSKKLASSIAGPMNRQLNILSKRGAYV